MDGFTPGVLDRLMDERRDAGGGASQLASEQVKELVARDLEALLNTRVALAPGSFDDYPQARASILNYGLADFAAFCLTSAEDRAAVCASIKSAIETHEPRLKDVSASLAPTPGSVNRLDFVINARLVLPDGADAGDAVNFSAVLQPSSLHYAVRRTARPRGPDGKR